MRKPATIHLYRKANAAGSASALALAASLALAPAAYAQQTVPGESANCPITAGEAVCEGDLNEGVLSDADDPVFDTLVLRNASAPINPISTNPGLAVTRTVGDITATIEDTVTIAATNTDMGQSAGVQLRTDDGNVTFTNAADISVTGTWQGISIDAEQSLITNSSDVTSGSSAMIILGGDGGHMLNNSGRLNSTGFSSGVFVDVESGNSAVNGVIRGTVFINNAAGGVIEGGDGIRTNSGTPTALVIDNDGIIRGLGQGGPGDGVVAQNGATDIENSGTISGANSIAINLNGTLLGGDDAIFNQEGGQIIGSVFTRDGEDQFVASNLSKVEGDVDTGADRDFVTLYDGSVVTGTVSTGDGDDIVGVNSQAGQPDGLDRASFGAIALGAGDDRATIPIEIFNSTTIDGGADSDELSIYSQLVTGNEEFTLAFDAPGLVNVERYASFSGGNITLMGTGGDFTSFFSRNGNYIVNGDYSGLTFSQDQSSLAGAGTLGDVSLGRGRFLRPGDGSVNGDGEFVSEIGTLTTGNLSLDGFTSGFQMTFEVQVNDQGQSDQVIVNGTVEIDDFVNLAVLDAGGGSFAGDDPFNFIIIDNDGSDAVTGTFNEITNELAFLTPTVSYTGGDGNDVTLTLTANNTGGGTDPDGCTPPAADGVTAVCRGVVTNQNDPNGYGTGAENGVTLTIAPDAVVTGSNNGIFLGEDADFLISSDATVTGNLGALIKSGDIELAGAVQSSNSALVIEGGQVPGASSILIAETGNVEATDLETNLSAVSIVVDSDVGAAIYTVEHRGSVTASGNSSNGIGVNIAEGGAIEVAISGSVASTSSTTLASAVNVNPGVGGRSQITLQDGADLFIDARDSVGLVNLLKAGTTSDIVIEDGASIAASGDNSVAILLFGSGGGTSDQTRAVNLSIADGASLTADDGPLITENLAAAAQTIAIDTALTLGAQIAATDAAALAIDLGLGDDTITLLPTASITGVTDLGAGEDTLVLAGDTGSAAELDFGGIASGQTTEPLAFRGLETLRKTGAGRWNLVGIDDAMRTARVESGVLAINAVLENTAFDLLAGAEMQLNSRIGDLTVTGGTLRIGNTARGGFTSGEVGSLTLDASSILAIDVSDQGSSDTLVTNGEVALGNAILRVDATGDFAGADPFEFLIIDNQATGSVDGIFGMINLPGFAFLDPSVSYTAGDGNDVMLTLARNDVAMEPLFPTAAETVNQMNAATALDSFDRTAGSDTDAVYGSFLFLTNAEAPVAFDASSGEIYASLVANQVERGALGASRLVARATETGEEGWSLFVDGAIGDGSIDADGNAASIDADTLGTGLGIDYRGEGNRWAFGARVSYSDQDVAVDARASRASGEGWGVGAFARYGTGGAGFTLIGAISLQDMDYTVSRNLEIGALDRLATGSAQIETLSAEATARYGIDLADNWAIGAIASLAYGDSALDALGETGAESLNLNITESSLDRTGAGGGIFVNYQDGSGYFDLAARYMAGSDRFAEIGATFEGNRAAPFLVRSPDTQLSALLIDAAGSVSIGGNWRIGGALQGATGEDTQWFSARATLSVGF